MKLRSPSDEEIAKALHYVLNEFTLADGRIDGEQLAEGFAFGRPEYVDAEDRAQARALRPAFTEAQWESILARSEWLKLHG
jgi:hypothetical protein